MPKKAWIFLETDTPYTYIHIDIFGARLQFGTFKYLINFPKRHDVYVMM